MCLISLCSPLWLLWVQVQVYRAWCKSLTLQRLVYPGGWAACSSSRHTHHQRRSREGFIWLSDLHMAVDLLGLPVSAKQTSQNSHSPHPGHLLGQPSLTNAHVPALSAGQGVFPASGTGVNSHRLADYQTIFDQFPDLLTWKSEEMFHVEDIKWNRKWTI
uniref:Uncharacterized protein n=1 Tax=Gopherus evgoodei TaxID=1825980 RepID=A0A8C4Y7A9_9SAUR